MHEAGDYAFVVSGTAYRKQLAQPGKRHLRMVACCVPPPEWCLESPYLNRSDASNASAVCTLVSDVPRVDRVRLYTNSSRRGRRSVRACYESGPHLQPPHIIDTVAEPQTQSVAALLDARPAEGDVHLILDPVYGVDHPTTFQKGATRRLDLLPRMAEAALPYRPQALRD